MGNGAERSFAVGDRLGYGVSGPLASPLVSAERTRALLEAAYEGGVRHFDTAPSYGDGEGERRLGDFIRRFPRYELLISTKVGVNASGLRKRIRDFSVDGVRRSIDASFGRLGVTALDWMLLHGPAPGELTDALFQVLDAERYSGRIGFLGVAGRGTELDAAAATGLFRIFMLPVHRRLPDDARARIARLRAGGGVVVGIETMSPAFPSHPAPFTAGAAWRLARTAFVPPARGAPIAGLKPAAALQWALGEGGADRAVITTSSLRHLATDIAAVAEAGPAPPRSG